jgi:hypothetical protein
MADSPWPTPKDVAARVADPWQAAVDRLERECVVAIAREFSPDTFDERHWTPADSIHGLSCPIRVATPELPCGRSPRDFLHAVNEWLDAHMAARSSEWRAEVRIVAGNNFSVVIFERPDPRPCDDFPCLGCHLGTVGSRLLSPADCEWLSVNIAKTIVYHGLEAACKWADDTFRDFVAAKCRASECAAVAWSGVDIVWHFSQHVCSPTRICLTKTGLARLVDLRDASRRIGARGQS